MRLLLKALLAATALIPVATAATAQDAPEREGRWRGARGSMAEAKIEARNEARGREAPPPQVQQPQAQRQPRWDGNRGARADGSADLRQQPRPEQRWNGDRGPGVPSRVDGGIDGRGRWGGRAGGRPAPDLPQANIAANRPGGPDRNNPRADRARGDGRADGRQGWNGQASQRDDRHFDPRNDGRPRGRDDRRGTDRDGWNPSNRNDRFGIDGWNQPRREDRFQSGGTWNRTWRNDRRYDWNRYRASNRYAYRLPRYYAPSGWSYGYRSYSIGALLNTQLWGEDYWIEDPYTYRLPEVYGPYRWVRYYDDALLVDIRTGRVVDVVNGIFW
jgi:hypothetical protein